MARYYLHLRYGRGPGKLALDREGDELADVGAVRVHALSVARDLIARTRSEIVRDWLTCTFEVTDARGRAVMAVPFSEAVPDEDQATAQSE